MSESEDSGEKSEEPTSKRLSKAREKGQVANSKDFTTWMLLFGFTMVLGAVGPYVVGGIRDNLTIFIAQAHQFPMQGSDLKESIFTILNRVLLYVIWPVIGLMILSIIGNVGQFGFLVSVESIKPKLSKINPIKGAKKYVSAKQLVEFAKNILKITIVGIAGALILIPHFDLLIALPGIDVAYLPQEIYFLLLKLMAVILIILFLMAIADVAYQRFKHKKDLRMTKQEVKEEFKNVEGDPQIKARIRQIRMQRAQDRMMQSVPNADVVVTNPTHFAVALEYKEDSMAAPKVLAKGQDVIAFKIRELAQEHEIPIVENPPLARALYATAEVDDFIPEDHYKPVAEVISFVYSLRERGKKAGKMQSSEKPIGDWQ